MNNNININERIKYLKEIKSLEDNGIIKRIITEELQWLEQLKKYLDNYNCLCNDNGRMNCCPQCDLINELLSESKENNNA